MKTQQGTIVTIMSQEKRTKKWFYPYDFADVSRVGYEASARFSELGRDYPDMIESMRDGKYIKRRIRWETIADWFPILDDDMKRILREHNPPAKPRQESLL